jgi:hypothetical protein
MYRIGNLPKYPMTTREERALIPYGLSLAVCLACEKELSIPPNPEGLGILEEIL